jgi:hypothetical protein
MPADENPPSVFQQGAGHPTLAQEADQVIAALRRLWGQVSDPVIQTVLEAARFDIAYLAAGGEGKPGA